jgi:hypothetical protein
VIGDEPRMTDAVGPRMNFWDRYNETDLYQMQQSDVRNKYEFSDLIGSGEKLLRTLDWKN